MSMYTVTEEEVRLAYHRLSMILRLLHLTQYYESYLDGHLIVGKWKKKNKPFWDTI